jgi:hypothetical protein
MQIVSVSVASALVLAGLVAPPRALGADGQESRFKVDPKTEIAMPLGITKIDFNFDGKPGRVVSTYNDIQTAHNGTKYLFVTADWKTVMFETAFPNQAPKNVGFPVIHQNEFNTSVGADYMTSDIRLLSDTVNKKTYAVVAFRDFGNTWVDSRPVTIELFTYTKLSPPNNDPGLPPEYFALTSWFVTKKCYPDANFALFAELGLKLPYRDQDGAVRADMSKPCDKP